MKQPVDTLSLPPSDAQIRRCTELLGEPPTVVALGSSNERALARRFHVRPPAIAVAQFLMSVLVSLVRRKRSWTLLKPEPCMVALVGDKVVVMSLDAKDMPKLPPVHVADPSQCSVIEVNQYFSRLIVPSGRVWLGTSVAQQILSFDGGRLER